MIKSRFILSICSLILVAFSLGAQAVTVTGYGEDTDTADWLTKTHTAKLNALQDAMKKCNSESVRRISVWEVIGPKVKGVECVPTAPEGVCENKVVYIKSATAKFECLAGFAPDLE